LPTQQNVGSRLAPTLLVFIEPRGFINLEPLLADSSGNHRVRVLGAPVLVERYAGVGYARFAMRSSARVEVEVTSPIRTHTIFPAEREGRGAPNVTTGPARRRSGSRGEWREVRSGWGGYARLVDAARRGVLGR
jgi:hypothetical protein